MLNDNDLSFLLQLLDQGSFKGIEAALKVSELHIKLGTMRQALAAAASASEQQKEIEKKEEE